MKRLIIIVIIIALAGGGWFVFRRQKATEKKRAAYEPVEFSRQTLELTIEATGIAEPENRVEIKPPIGGRIEEVLVEEGETVKEGRIIARMSSTERAALLDAARAEGGEVLEKWERVYKATPIIAPLAGTIIARHAEPGQTVTASDAVFVLSDHLIVKAQVDETDIGQIAPGQEVKGSLDAYPDIHLEGAVSHIAYEATTVNNVTIYEVKIIPKRTPRQMKSGMTATVRFLVGSSEDALTLPVDAVMEMKGQSMVQIDTDANPETAPELRRVKTGLKSGGRIEILEGLNGDERVVRSAFHIPQQKDMGSTPFMPERRRRR